MKAEPFLCFNMHTRGAGTLRLIKIVPAPHMHQYDDMPMMVSVLFGRRTSESWAII